MGQAHKDEIATGPAEVAIGLGATRFAGMGEMVAFATMMSESGPAVPQHLRGQPGACLAITTKALRFGFDPFTLAEHSFLTTKGFGTEQEETIAYDSFVIRSIINAHAPITGELAYSYEGEGDARTCTVTATPSDGSPPKSLTSPPLGELKAWRTENGVLRGSPLWETKPDIQMGYDTGRDFCRLHHPEILMGWYDKDELVAKRAPKPKPQVAARLKGAKGDGFNTGGLAKALAHVPEKVVRTDRAPATTATKPRKATKRKKAKGAQARLQKQAERLAAAVLSATPKVPAAFVTSETKTAMSATARSEF
jgi:hypothetical protein